MQKIVENAGLTWASSSKDTSVKHEQMVQFDCTDWDFMLTRAQVNERLLIVNFKNGKEEIELYEPKLSSAKHTFDYTKRSFKGSEAISVKSIELTCDGRYQTTDFGASWDLKKQALVNPGNPPPFSTDHKSVAEGIAKKIKADKSQLISTAPIDPQETKSWAAGKTMSERLGILRGRLTILGTTDIEPGQVLDVKNIGEGINGKVLITAVRHRANETGWSTDIQFGLPPKPKRLHTAREDQLSSSPLPWASSLEVGLVQAFEKDKEGPYRVKVKVPAIPEKDSQGKKIDNVLWARLCSIGSSVDSGIFYRPLPDDEVILGFFRNDPRHPVILGSLHNKDKKKHNEKLVPIDEKNQERGIITPRGTQFLFHDEKDKDKVSLIAPGKTEILLDDTKDKAKITMDGANKTQIILDDAKSKSKITLKSAKGHEVTLDDSGKNIKLKDTNDNQIEMKTSGIILKAKGSSQIEMKSSNITIKVGGNQIDLASSGITIKTSAKVNIMGSQIEMK